MKFPFRRAQHDEATEPQECQGADFSKLMAHLGANLEAHADRDGLDGVRRGIFLARGGHAPGEACPTAPPLEPQHHYECEWPDDECTCHRYGWKP